MADTINVPITTLNEWVEVTEAVSKGFLTSTKSIQFCQRTSNPPDDFIGHHLVTMKSFRYSVAGTKLHIKTTEPVILVITED